MGTKCFSTSLLGSDSDTERIDSTALSLTTVSSTVAKFSRGGYSITKQLNTISYAMYTEHQREACTSNEHIKCNRLLQTYQ